MADPGRRGRPGQRRARQARPLGLGGRGGAARSPRGLPAGPRRPAGPARSARPALRPFRRGLRAHPHRLRAVERRRGCPVPQLRRGGGRAGSRLRRLDVRRAWRRAGALGAAGTHVLQPGAGAVRRRQAHLRPRQPAQPRGAGRPAPAGCRPAAAGGRRLEPSAARRGVRRRRAPLHRRRQVPCRLRDHVPQLPGDRQGAGFHPWPGARAAGDGERHPGDEGLAGSGGRRGPGSLPVLQGLRQRVPHRHRRGRLQVAGARGGPPPPAAAAQPLRAGLAADLGSGHHRRPGPGRRGQRHPRRARHRPGGSLVRGRRPAAQPAALRLPARTFGPPVGG